MEIYKGTLFQKKSVQHVKPGLAGSPEKFTLHRGSPESSVVAVGIHLELCSGDFQNLDLASRVSVKLRPSDSHPGTV